MPQLKDEEGWCLFCFGSECDPSRSSAPVDDHTDINDKQKEVIIGGRSVKGMDTSTTCIENELSAGATRNRSNEKMNITVVEENCASDKEVSVTSNDQIVDKDSLLKRKREVAYQMGIVLTRVRDAQSDNDCECEDSDSVDQMALDEAFDSNMEAALEAQRWSGDRNMDPSKSLLLQFDQALVQRVLGYHIGWLQERFFIRDSPSILL